MTPTLPPLTESEFQTQVVQYARLHGWRVHHVAAARTNKGYRVPCRYDAQGFPDLLMCRRQRLIVAELKVGSNACTMPQMAWIRALEAAGVYSVIWRPSDWPDIERTLA